MSNLRFHYFNFLFSNWKISFSKWKFEKQSQIIASWGNHFHQNSWGKDKKCGFYLLMVNFSMWALFWLRPNEDYFHWYLRAVPAKESNETIKKVPVQAKPNSDSGIETKEHSDDESMLDRTLIEESGNWRSDDREKLRIEAYMKKKTENGKIVCVFVYLCRPQKLQISIATPSDELSLILGFYLKPENNFTYLLHDLDFFW